MTASVSAETALVLDRSTAVRRPVVVSRWAEVAMLAIALLIAPLAFVVGLVIYAVRHYTR